MVRLRQRRTLPCNQTTLYNYLKPELTLGKACSARLPQQRFRILLLLAAAAADLTAKRAAAVLAAWL
jgi:hypothetical protein